MYRIRHQLVLALVLLLGTFALASAQGEQPEKNDGKQDLPLLVAPSHMVTGEWEPLTLEEVDASEVPASAQNMDGSDTCSAAPQFNIPGGAQSVTNGNTTSASDPVLACMWGSPGSVQGYRTTWFKFNSPFSGRVTIDTAGSTYDTVLAVYTGGCVAPTQLACNDDHNHFSSQVSISVYANQDYYVEVAAWHLGVSGTATANISAFIDKETNWEIDNLMTEPRTRHSVAVVHDNIYVISGQTVAFGNPVRTPRVDRYNTTIGHWTQMTSMPAGSDGLGYSNTSAAEVNGNIYLPSGYIGDESIYDGTHWVYSIGGNTWFTVAPVNWAGNQPAIYHEAVSYTGGGLDGYYVIGGLTGPLPLTTPNSSWESHREMYFYNPTINVWFVRPPMSSGRFGHTAAVQRIGNKDYICVVGGIGQNGNTPILLSGGECYDIDGDVWTTVTGALNYPRYNAGSAVAPNGDWYVFGGTNNIGESVAITEKYDRGSNTWIALNSRFNLGSEDPNEPLRPARAWPRGGFVGQTLWVVGGHRNTSFGDLVVNLVEKLFLPLENVYIPFLRHEQIPGEPDDTFEDARQIAVGQALLGTFYSPDDYVDVYYFDRSITYSFTAVLSNMPIGVNNDLAIYTSNKVFLGRSENPGAINETITGTLNPGRYFLVVERVTPPPGSDPHPSSYRIELH
jgi:Kelch motif